MIRILLQSLAKGGRMSPMPVQLANDVVWQDGVNWLDMSLQVTE